MGFHIVVNGDKQFVTAGHCGFRKPTDWYHTGYGQVGTLASTIFESHDRDLMRVKMNDTQASNFIYGSGRDIIGARSPVQGDTLCASLGRMNSIDCGSVTVAWEQYFTDTCGVDCPLWGTRFEGVTYFEGGGDSGSPIYSGGTLGTATAVGIVSSQLHFANIQSGLNVWNAAVITN